LLEVSWSVILDGFPTVKCKGHNLGLQEIPSKPRNRNHGDHHLPSPSTANNPTFTNI
jgi:hypothetical protein